jgi:hypothetical protein
MKRLWLLMLSVSLLAGICAASWVDAAPPWQSLVPFKKVEADPNKEYRLTEDDGPWLIMCRSFAGDTAEEDARALVLELRQRFKLKSYLHVQEYDFTKPEIGKGFDQFGRPKVMKPANGTKFKEYAVLVGDFSSAEDPKVESTLEAIKYAWPNCLDIKSGKGQSQRFWGLRIVTREKIDKTDGKGPMRMAFLTRNPMLPDEYFAPKGIDPLVKNMNKGLEYSLLKNRGKYSVRIATFRGNVRTTVRAKDYEKAAKEMTHSKLEEGEQLAHKLTLALRAQGVEAYEFHDLHESMVTVGSFESVGDPQPDGTIEINPAVHRIIETYKGQSKQPGALTAQKIAGVTLDIQPMPVIVPKESIGAAYAQGNR